MSTGEEQECEECVCQSVVMFACKGVIEGIMVLLFLWLLVQVLFTKQLEVHLQVLLSVGLVLLCSTLILGCVLCWYRTRQKPAVNKAHVTSPAPPDSVGHMTAEFSPSSSGATSTLDGEVPDNTSVLKSPTPSDETFTSAVSEVKHKVCFQMRRLSSPTVSTSLYRPVACSRSSLPSFPRLGFLTKTRKVVESVVNDEHKRLTPYTLTSLQTHDLQIKETPFPNYGSNSCNETSFLHFILNFSSTRNTLTVTLVGITGKVHSLDDITVQVRTSPLCPQLLGMLKSSEKTFVVHVGSLEGLKGCTLRLSVFSLDHTEASLLGEVEVCCGGLDWAPDKPISCVRELEVVNQTGTLTL